MKRLLLTLSSVLFLCLMSQGQQFSFQIEKDGIELGKAQLWVATEQDQQTYALQLSEMDCFPLAVSSITCNYFEGELTSSAASGNLYTYTKAEGGFLHMIQDGKYQPQKSRHIKTSLTRLLVEQPTTDKVLIEYNGKILPIQRIERNIFQVILSEEISLTFTYEGGSCSTLFIQTQSESWKMTLVDKLTL